MSEHLKEALAYAVRLRDDQKIIYKEEEKVFFDRSKADLVELDPIKRAETLTVNSLSGLIGYLQSKFSHEEVTSKLLIHVESPTNVAVYSALDVDRKREKIIEAKALLEVFPYSRFMDSEEFIINVQSLIQRDLDAKAILECASAIRIEGGGDLVDNGVSQVATVKEGAATLTKAEVPSPANLRPYRTFLEVEQPDSPFVFRINKYGHCALFEADGGIWKHVAMERIHEYLNQSLNEYVEKGSVTIIA